MIRRFVDYETRSLCNLPAQGAILYANDPSTEILMAGLADDETSEPYLAPLAGDADQFISWGRFDYLIYRSLENPEFESRQWIDAMALARYTGMPAGLDAFATALGFGRKKDPRGKRLINKYCIPTAAGTFTKLEGEDLEAMQDYAIQDVRLLQEAWRTLHFLLPEWEQYMRRGYEAVERMNENGVPIDVEAAERALALCEAHDLKLVSECESLCGYRPSQSLKIAEFLGLNDCTRATLESMTFEDPVQERVREIRLESAKAATKKLKPMIQMASTTGRAYGCFIPNGAHTGRGSSRAIQFQNMKRAVVDPEVFRKLHAGEGFAEPLRTVQENIRGFIRPPSDHVLVGVDYSQVEARIAAWLADCQPMLDAFMDPERDVYREAAGRIYDKPPGDVTSEERTFGKIAVLGAGYGAGGKALASQGDAYGLSMTDAEGVALQKSYKAEFPEIPLYWDLLEAAAKDVVAGHAQIVRVGPLAFRLNNAGTTLELILPSGRKMRFLFPHIDEDRFGNPAVSVLTKHGRRVVWGGHWMENICQAIATDLKLDAMVRLTDLGLHTVMEVHDELVFETTEPDVVLHDATVVMEDPPRYMPPGLIRVEGAIMERYTKT